MQESSDISSQIRTIDSPAVPNNFTPTASPPIPKSQNPENAKPIAKASETPPNPKTVEAIKTFVAHLSGFNEITCTTIQDELTNYLDEVNDKLKELSKINEKNSIETANKIEVSIEKDFGHTITITSSKTNEIPFKAVVLKDDPQALYIVFEREITASKPKGGKSVFFHTLRISEEKQEHYLSCKFAQFSDQEKKDSFDFLYKLKEEIAKLPDDSLVKQQVILPHKINVLKVDVSNKVDVPPKKDAQIAYTYIRFQEGEMAEPIVGDIDRLESLGEQLLKIIAELHEMGITHNDIKPANLIIFEDKLYLIDFDTAVEKTCKMRNTGMTATNASPETTNQDYHVDINSMHRLYIIRDLLINYEFSENTDDRDNIKEIILKKYNKEVEYFYKLYNSLNESVKNRIEGMIKYYLQSQSIDEDTLKFNILFYSTLDINDFYLRILFENPQDELKKIEFINSKKNDIENLFNLGNKELCNFTKSLNPNNLEETDHKEYKSTSNLVSILSNLHNKELKSLYEFIIKLNEVDIIIKEFNINSFEEFTEKFNNNDPLLFCKLLVFISKEGSLKQFNNYVEKKFNYTNDTINLLKIFTDDLIEKKIIEFDSKMKQDGIKENMIIYSNLESHDQRVKSDSYQVGLVLRLMFAATDPIPAPYDEIIEGLLQEDPQQRMTVADALQLFKKPE